MKVTIDLGKALAAAAQIVTVVGGIYGLWLVLETNSASSQDRLISEASQYCSTAKDMGARLAITSE